VLYHVVAFFTTRSYFEAPYMNVRFSPFDRFLFDGREVLEARVEYEYTYAADY